MELMKYLVTYADGVKKLYSSLDSLCYQPTDKRDEIVDCRIIYGNQYLPNLQEELKETNHSDKEKRL